MKRERYVANEKKLESNQAVSIRREWEEIEKLWELINTSNDVEKIKELLPHMYNLIEQFGFWDNLVDFLNYGDKNEDIVSKDGIFSRMSRYAFDSTELMISAYTNPNDKNNELYIRKKQIEDQIKENDNMEEPELMANAMELSNTIIQLISNNKEKLQQLGINTKRIIVKSTIIKRYFQNQLIKCKNRGENLLVNITNDTMRVSIPRYFEPFSSKIRTSDYSKLDTLVDNDMCFFCKDNGEPMNTTFPIKATEKQVEIMNYLAQNSNEKKLNRVRGRITYFQAVNKMLKPDEKQKISKPITKQIHGKSNKDINLIIEENREFFERLNEEIGGYIPKEFIDHLIEHASYSMEKIYIKIKPEIEQALSLVDIPENDINVETLKMFLYMRITKPISQLNNSKMQKGKLKSIIEDSVLEYSDAMDLFRILVDQNKDYKTIRKALRKREFDIQLKNSQPEVDILDSDQDEDIENSKEDDDSSRDDERNDSEEASIYMMARKIQEFRKQLEALKKEYEENKKQLEELRAELAKNNSAKRAKDEAVSELQAHSKRIDELKEERRKIDEAIANEEAEERKSSQKVKDLAQEVKREATQNSQKKDDIRLKEEEQKEIESRLEEMERKQQVLEEFLK